MSNPTTLIQHLETATAVTGRVAELSTEALELSRAGDALEAEDRLREALTLTMAEIDRLCGVLEADQDARTAQRAEVRRFTGGRFARAQARWPRVSGGEVGR